MSDTDESGSPERTQTIYRDISLNKIPDAILIASADTRRIVRVNTAATELFQCQRSDLVGRHQMELHPTSETDEYLKAFQRGLDDQRVNRLESGDPVFIETANGRHIPVEINVKPLTQNGNDYLMGIFRESSEQLAREQAINRTTNRLETLLETIPVPVASLDADGTVREWNRSATDTFGYTADKIIGENYSLFTDSEEYSSIFNRVTEEGAIYDYETTLRSKDGSRIPVTINVAPIYENGTVSRLVGTAIDVSNRRQRERQLDLLHRIIRHNLRNELSIVRGWGNMITESNCKKEKAIEKIKNASERLLDLSDDVRQIPRAMSRDQQKIQTLEIDEFISILCESLQSNGSVTSTEITVKSTTGQVPSTAVKSVSSLFDNLFECSDCAATRLNVDTTDSYTEISMTSNTRFLSSGQKSLINRGTETSLQHASELKIARSYLIIKSIGGSVTVEQESADADAGSLRIEIPRADT